MINSAFISPHPPLLLPGTGTHKDKEKVRLTIDSLNLLGSELKMMDIKKIIISSPHEGWGFDVPLFFVAKDFCGKIDKYLTGSESPMYYFNQGEIIGNSLENDSDKIAVIASGDMSHCLKADGPYGYHPHGPIFDKVFIESLKKMDIKEILSLDDRYPDAGECGLRSFSYLLGILAGSGKKWQPEILAYEGPFGVGYLTVKFNICR